MSNPTKIGGQEPSEPPSAEPPSAETAEEENPAIAAFNSWGGEGSPPPPGFAHAPPAAGMPARRRTIGRTGSIARQAQSPPPVRARRPGQPPIDAIRTRFPPAQAAPRPAADFLGSRLSDLARLAILGYRGLARGLERSRAERSFGSRQVVFGDLPVRLGRLFRQTFFSRVRDLSSESPREYYHRQSYTIHSSTMTPMTGPPSSSAGGPGASSSVLSSL